MDDLEKMKAEFSAKGGKVTVLPATKYEEIVGDASRVKYWGEGIDTKQNKDRKNSLRNEGLTVQEVPEQRNEYGGITGSKDGTQTCTMCHQRKEAKDYYSKKISKRGTQAACKECQNMKKSAMSDETIKRGQDLRKKRMKENTPEKIRSCRVEKALKEKVYADCKYRSSVGKTDFEVDHIWPIAKGGPDFSGNMQIITKYSNRQKSDDDVPVELKQEIRMKMEMHIEEHYKWKK